MTALKPCETPYHPASERKYPLLTSFNAALQLKVEEGQICRFRNVSYFHTYLHCLDIIVNTVQGYGITAENKH